MIIRCTQKLLKELKLKPEDEVADNFLESWHANLFYIERRKCVLVTNDSTLFTIFIPSLKKPDFKTFPFIFGQQVFKNLIQEEIPQELIEVVLSACEKITYSKTNNRSVLGSMNEQKMMLEHIIYSQGGLPHADLYEIHHELNRNILSAIDYNYPIDVFKQELEKMVLHARR